MTATPRYRRRQWQLALGMAALCAVLSFGACIFDTRDANPPGQEGGPSVTLDKPEKVFVAIRTSFEKDNDVDYERAIDESFIFSPLLDDSLDQDLIGTGVYVDWNKEVELDVLNVLLSESKLSVEFETTPVINENTFVRFNTIYALAVITPSVPQPDTTVYAGTSDIDVRNIGGNWRITYWKDRSAEGGFRTWGYLRGITRLRLNP